MKQLVLAAALGLLMGGCAVQQHAYTTVSSARIYEDDYMTSRRLQDVPAGDTVWVRHREQVGSLYLIPVTYRGFRVYAYAPELVYLGAGRAPKKSNRRVEELVAYESPGANTATARRHYRSYPGGMVFISVADSTASKHIAQKDLSGKGTKIVAEKRASVAGKE